MPQAARHLLCTLELNDCARFRNLASGLAVDPDSDHMVATVGKLDSLGKVTAAIPWAVFALRRVCGLAL